MSTDVKNAAPMRVRYVSPFDHYVGQGPSGTATLTDGGMVAVVWDNDPTGEPEYLDADEVAVTEGAEG